MEIQLHRTTILRRPPPLVTFGYTKTTEETLRKVKVKAKVEIEIEVKTSEP
jgi:hypothetical protein